MDGILPGAKPSPRVENGCLCWYEGNTFEVGLLFEMEDRGGIPITMQPGETVTVTFYDNRCKEVHAFVFTDIQDNTVTMEFTEEVTRKFPKGKYVFDAVYDHTERTTLIREDVAIVG